MKDAAASQETSLVLQTWLSKRVTRLVSVYVHGTVHLNGTAHVITSRDHLPGDSPGTTLTLVGGLGARQDTWCALFVTLPGGATKISLQDSPPIVL